MRTFQTRLNLTEEISKKLDQCAQLSAKVEHSLFVDLQKQDLSLNEIKKYYLSKFGITARQFNSIRSVVEGKISSLKELQKQRIINLTEKLKRINKRLSSKRTQSKHRLYQKKQREENRLDKLNKDKKASIVHCCFGSRKLFRAQYHLEENGFKSHEEWLQAWQEKRNSSFFLMGSKDETAGNQTCVGKIELDETLSLRLRLPNTFEEKYITIECVQFNYGHDLILNALRENLTRKSLQKEKNLNYKSRGVAISYRFMKDKKGWRLFTSVQLKPCNYVTKKKLGCIGIDLNIDHLALVETDRSGNPIDNKRFSLNLYGKSKNQAKALIGDVAKALVSTAKMAKKPLVLEKLDFQAKKQTLSQGLKRYARMLSSFSYQKILEMIKARACREGVEVLEENPAYTSQIGKIKFAKKYGLSIHHSAALCIARRVNNFSELLPCNSDIPNGKGAYVAFVVPVRTQQRTFWSYLGVVSRKLKAALAEHMRVTKSQSVGRYAPT